MLLTLWWDYYIKFVILWCCLQLHISCSAHRWPLEAIPNSLKPLGSSAVNLTCPALCWWFDIGKRTWHTDAFLIFELCIWVFLILCCVFETGVQWVRILITLWTILYAVFSGVDSFQEGTMSTFRKPQGRQANDTSMAMNFLYCDQ